jgi:hypothetical protein
MIATPMYGGQCTAHFTYYNIELTKMAMQRGIEIQHQFLFTESLITRGRNSLANTFMSSDFTHMLFIDADIGFKPADVFKLMEHDLDLVCGGYPAKLIDWNLVHKAATNGVPPEGLSSFASPYIYNSLPGNDTNVVKEVIEAGTGFMMIKRSVFDTLKDHVPEYTSNQFGSGVGTKIKEYFATSIQDGFLLSEDYHFCRLYRKHGGKVFLDTSISLQHIGTNVFQSSPNHTIR